MNKAMKILVVVALAAVVSFVIGLKQKNKGTPTKPAGITANENDNKNMVIDGTSKALPSLVDLGAGKCIPCKMMKPILDELTENYKDQFKVTFIDVWENPDEKTKYNIKLIPTQIFYDSSGKELFRHEGFFSKEDILGKWKDFGMDFEKVMENETK